MSTERDFLILPNDEDYSGIVCYVCSNNVTPNEGRISCSFCSNVFHHKCLNFTPSQLEKAHEYYQCDECNETDDLFIEERSNVVQENSSCCPVLLNCFNSCRLHTHQEENRMNLDLQTALVKERQSTDKQFIYIKLIFIVILLILLVCCMLSDGVNKFTKGLDSCGNICGEVNEPFHIPNNNNCTALDLIRKRYLLIKEPVLSFPDILLPKFDHRECVQSCDHAVEIMHFCIRFGDWRIDPISTGNISSSANNSLNTDHSGGLIHYGNTFGDMIQIIIDAKREGYINFHRIILAGIIPSGLYIPSFLLIRYLPSLYVWGTVITGNIIGVGAAIYYWYEYSKSEEENSNIPLWIPFVLTTVSVILIIVMFLVRRKYKVVEKIIKEIGRVSAAIPSLFILPFMTFSLIILIGYIWFHFTLWIQSSGYNNIYDLNDIYQMSFLHKLTRWLNLLAIFWTLQFIFKCQDMLIAGSVVRWYFAREKSQLKWPLITSLFILIRCHLGSVLASSISLYKTQAFFKFIIKFILSICFVTKKDVMKFGYLVIQLILRVVNLDVIDTFINLTEKYGCIEIAIYGQKYSESRSRGFELQLDYLSNSFAINCLGKFILNLAKLVFFTVAFFITLIIYVMMSSNETDSQYTAMIYLMFLCIYIQASFFFSVFHTILETLFICICEDLDANNGESKPYYMRKTLVATFNKSWTHEKYQNGHEMVSPGFPYQPTTEEITSDPLL